MKNWLKLLLILSFFLGISMYANLKFQNIPDPDSLYHMRHAWVYRINGVFDSSFPWTQFSVIRVMGADLWYGFHVFLIPLTYISDLTIAIKIAAILTTFLVLASLYMALKNINVKFPELWAIFFLFSSPAIITRMTMTRPHPISLGLTALIFSFFVRGSAIPVFVFSFILSWIHSSIFWFPVLVIGFLIIFQRLYGQAVNIRKIAAFSGGIVAGLMARPHPLANLKLIYIQVVDLYLSKNHELAQVIGAELRPPTWDSTYDQRWFFIVFVVALAYLGWHVYKKSRTFLTEKVWGDVDNKIITLSSLALITLSLFMYMTARRAIDQLGLFIIFFAGLIFSLSPFFKRKIKATKEYFIIIFLLLGLSAYNLAHVNFSSYHSPTKFKESALWLKENTNRGNIVFHLNWTHFPFLFFWNQDNYYINGMDPVFLLKYDEKLYRKLLNTAINETDDKKFYWKLDNVAISDMGGITCGYKPKQCRPETVERVSDVLKNDFHASYVFVTQIHRAFLDYLTKDKENFEKVYENEKEEVVIFKVL